MSIHHCPWDTQHDEVLIARLQTLSRANLLMCCSAAPFVGKEGIDMIPCAKKSEMLASKRRADPCQGYRVPTCIHNRTPRFRM
jgi:hypothetical protein